MKRLLVRCLLAAVLIPVWFSQSRAELEWDIRQTLNLKAPPVDVAMSRDGKWIFVLTETGSIQVYTPGGRLQETIQAGRHVDGIKAGPREDLLILSSRQNKTVQIVTLDFITPVDVSRAPFKGPADAPVVMVVFSDFE